AAAPSGGRGRGCGGAGGRGGRGACGVGVPGGAGVAGHRRQGMTAAAIAGRGLGKDFGSIRALDALDLEVREGEFFGFLGPNGAGKTTTVHIFATLLAPCRGSASVSGYDVVRADLQVRCAIGLVLQETTV